MNQKDLARLWDSLSEHAAGQEAASLDKLQADLTEHVLSSRLYPKEEAGLEDELRACMKREALLESLYTFDERVEKRTPSRGRGGGRGDGFMPLLPEARLAQAKDVPPQARLPPRPVSSSRKRGSRRRTTETDAASYHSMHSVASLRRDATSWYVNASPVDPASPKRLGEGEGGGSRFPTVVAASHGAASPTLLPVASAVPDKAGARPSRQSHVSFLPSDGAPSYREEEDGNEGYEGEDASDWSPTSIPRNPLFCGFSQAGTELTEEPSSTPYKRNAAPQRTAKSASQWRVIPARPSSARDHGRHARARAATFQAHDASAECETPSVYNAPVASAASDFASEAGDDAATVSTTMARERAATPVLVRSSTPPMGAAAGGREYGYVHPAVYETYSPEAIELQHLASTEALLLSQIEEEERRLQELRDAHEAKDAAYAQELLSLRTQRRSKRVSKPSEVHLQRLRKRDMVIGKVSAAFERRRQALEQALMLSHDRDGGAVGVVQAIRCDALRSPLGQVYVAATGSVPPELYKHVKTIARKNGGVQLHSSRHLIYVFGSMAAAAYMVQRAQALMANTGWGEEVMDQGVPQLAFGIAAGVAEFLTQNGKRSLNGRVVQLAVRMEKQARYGEALIHHTASQDFYQSQVTCRACYAGGTVHDLKNGNVVYVPAGATIRDRPSARGGRGYQQHKRIAYEIEDRSAALENERMLMEDYYLKSKKAPSGQVTIAFTDIQNSITMWDLYPNAMRVAVDLQNKILRNLLELYNGYEVKNEGDAFMVAFADVSRAMQWGMDLQLRLLKATWPGEISSHPDAQTVHLGGKLVFHGLRIRIGFTTGEPDCCIDPITGRMDYFGPMVNLAARVSGQAKGGECVVGNAAMNALQQARTVPSPYVIVSGKGTKMLKGISKAETIFQLCPKSLEKRKEYFASKEKKKDSAKKKDEDEERKEEEDPATGQRKASVWDRILVTRKRGKRKTSLDQARQQELLKMQKILPKLVERYKMLERYIGEHERALMEQEDQYLHSRTLAPSGADTTIVCVDMDGKLNFLAHAPEETINMILQFADLVRHCIKRHKGYEVKSDGPAFMVAFPNALHAFNFAVDLQQDVLYSEWPDFIEEVLHGVRVANDEGTILFNGPRLRISCESGQPTFCWNDASRRVDYVGRLPDQTELLCALCEAGEIGLGIKAYSDLLKIDDDRQGSVLSGSNIIIKTYRGKSRIETFFSLVPWVWVDRREVWREPQIQSKPIEPRAVVDFSVAIYQPVVKSPIEQALETLHERVMGKLRELHMLVTDYGDLVAAEVAEVIDEFHSGPARVVATLVQLFTETSGAVHASDWARHIQQTLLSLDSSLITEDDVIKGNDTGSRNSLAFSLTGQTTAASLTVGLFSPLSATLSESPGAGSILQEELQESKSPASKQHSPQASSLLKKQSAKFSAGRTGSLRRGSRGSPAERKVSLPPDSPSMHKRKSSRPTTAGPRLSLVNVQTMVTPPEDGPPLSPTGQGQDAPRLGMRRRRKAKKGSTLAEEKGLGLAGAAKKVREINKIAKLSQTFLGLRKSAVG